MKNMAILKAMADSSGEVLYMFADDFKDFFNQFRVAAHQRYLTSMIWFDATNDFEPVFVEELRMGFGGSPNSKIAQRFSNAMMREFAKRFAAFVEANMDRIPPKLANLIEHRRRNLSGGNRYQWLPGATAFFTDDCKFAIIMVCFGAGARGPGSLGLAPVVATASFPLINLPNFILASLS